MKIEEYDEQRMLMLIFLLNVRKDSFLCISIIISSLVLCGNVIFYNTNRIKTSFATLLILFGEL